MTNHFTSVKTLPVQITLLFLLLSLSSHAYRDSLEYFDIAHYRFAVQLSDTSYQIMVNAGLSINFPNGHQEKMSLDLHANSESTGRGMRVSDVKVNSAKAKFDQKGETLTIELGEAMNISDTALVEIQYSGIPENGLIIARNEYGRRTFFADHWPNRAHYWLPVVDHPLEKATCEFIVSVPEKYDVVANGNLISDQVNDGIRTTHWHETKPIPTKVMVIGVAEFITKKLDDEGFSTVWVYKDTGEEGFQDFAEAKDIYKLLVERMGEYPFSKLDHVESKTLYAGMENAGNIFYDEKRINGTQAIGGLIAHEMGHQWFGNAVSEASWNDVWVSEGFAEFCEYYYVEQTLGHESLQKKVVQDEKKINRYERKYPDQSIYIDEIGRLQNILSPLVYEKGALLLRNLRHRVGEQVFWDIIRRYYQTYKYQNASSGDFIAVAEQVSGQELNQFFRQWLMIPGAPRVTYSVTKTGKNYELAFTQHTDQPYEIYLDIKTYKGSTEEIETFWLKGKTTTLKIKSSREFEIDPFNYVYGEIVER